MRLAFDIGSGLTLGVAFWGAITGSLGLLLAYLNHREGRRRYERDAYDLETMRVRGLRKLVGELESPDGATLGARINNVEAHLSHWPPAKFPTTERAVAVRKGVTTHADEVAVIDAAKSELDLYLSARNAAAPAPVESLR